MKKKHTHCRHCGEELFDFVAEAENVRIDVWDGLGVSSRRLDSRFNKQGERNYATAWQCPNYGSKPWYFFWQVDPHDIFVEYEGETHIPSNL